MRIFEHVDGFVVYETHVDNRRLANYISVFSRTQLRRRFIADENENQIFSL